MSDFPTKILLATDGSEDAALASRAAVELSVRSGSELHVVHAWLAPTHSTYEPTSKMEYPLLQKLLAQELLEEQVERLEALEGKVAEAHLRRGSPAEEITSLSEDLEADLLIVGSRGLGTITSLVLGSVSEKVTYLAPCPTLVVRGEAGAWTPKRVIIGDDASEGAKRAAAAAVGIAKLFEAQVVLVRTGYPEPQLTLPGQSWQSLRTQREREALARMHEKRRIKKALEKRAGELEERLGRQAHVRTAVGDAAAFILEVAAEGEETPLIAVGSRGLGTVKSIMLGSVSRKVLRAASGPVLIAP
jgi:nucleotide-binding universal stress UspA family protein